MNCPRPAAKNNIPHPTAVSIGSRSVENITVVSVGNSAWHPHQTSCEEVSDAEILRIYKNPSAQASVESITNARDIMLASPQ